MNKFTAIIILLIIGFVALIYVASQNTPESTIDREEVLQVRENDRVQGNPDSDVVLVEYADIECPACAAYHPLVKEIASAYEDEVAFVYRHFPLAIHPNANTAAWATEAAGEQGQFFEMVDILFTRQSEWAGERTDISIFYPYAEELGLDMDQFRADANSTAIRDLVAEQYREGQLLGVNSTPTFYLQGERITGMQSTDDFAELINAALQAENSDTTSIEGDQSTTSTSSGVVRLTASGMIGNLTVEVDGDTVEVDGQQMGQECNPESQNLSVEESQAFKSALAGINPETIDQISAPSQQYMVDGDWGAVLSVESNAVTYSSEMFDLSNPPAEFQELAIWLRDYGRALCPLQ